MALFNRRVASFALLATGLFTAGPSALASATNVSSTQVSQDAEAPKTQPFHLLVVNELSSDLIETSSPMHSAEYDFIIAPSYKFSPDWSIMAKSPYKKELTGQQRILFQDAKVALSRSPIPLDAYQKFFGAVAVRIPLSDESRNVNSEIIGGQLGLELDNDLGGVGIRNVSLNYQIQAGRNFYTYSASANGQGNIEYDLTQRVDLAYQLSDKFSFTGTGRYITGLDYLGNTNNKFELDEELDCQVAKAWSVGVGHSNMANVLDPDGRSSNLSVYNPYTSTVFGVLSFTY